MLWFNPVSSYIIGVDLNDESTRLCIADLTGKPCLPRITLPPAMRTGRRRRLTWPWPKRIEAGKISHMTISVPGGVNMEGVVLRASRLRWRNYDLKGCWQALPFPIDVHNDVNLALIGERLFGTGKNCSDLIYLTLGKGIGCGILCNGQMVMGSTFMAGEISHYQDDPKNIRKRGDTPLEHRLGSARFQDFPGGMKEALEGYSNGESACCEIIEDFISTLSVVIANIAAFLDPDQVIIGGELSQYMDGLIEDIRETVARISPFQVRVSWRVCGGRLYHGRRCPRHEECERGIAEFISL